MSNSPDRTTRRSPSGEPVPVSRRNESDLPDQDRASADHHCGSHGKPNRAYRVSTRVEHKLVHELIAFCCVRVDRDKEPASFLARHCNSGILKQSFIARRRSFPWVTAESINYFPHPVPRRETLPVFAAPSIQVVPIEVRDRVMRVSLTLLTGVTSVTVCEVRTLNE